MSPDLRDFAGLPPFAPTEAQVVMLNGEKSALQWAFDCSIPPFARAATRGDRMGAAPGPKGAAPAVQWCYSAFHICHHFENGIKAFQVEDDEETEALLLEVRGLRACPADLGLEREHFCTPFGEHPLGPAPLLLVSYVHHTKWTLDNAAMATASRFVRRAEQVVKVRAASASEVRYAADALALHRRRGTDGFFDSAIYPPRRADVERSIQDLTKAPGDVCALCGAKASFTCGQCKMAMYCSRDHQKEHWKSSHKALCNGATTKRASFVFEATITKPDNAPYFMNINHNTGATSDGTMTSKNIHGDREFVVKLQPPMAGEGPWMCYDEKRSFQCFIPEQTSGLPAALTLLRNKGVKVRTGLGGVGLKGFFTARWEGRQVRVFTDSLVPNPGW